MQNVVTDIDLAENSGLSIIGTGVDKFRAKAEAVRSVCDSRYDRWPERALLEYIADGEDDAVGGSIQKAFADQTGFYPLAHLYALKDATGSPNASTSLLGYDVTDDLPNVGNFIVSVMAR